MSKWKQIKQWAGFSDDERIGLDRRAFLKGMTVTSAGLLMPMATLFLPLDRGLELDRGRIADPEGFELREISWVDDPLPGFELRTEAVVLGPDDPHAREMGFSIFERTGVGLYNPRGLMKLEVVR